MDSKEDLSGPIPVDPNLCDAKTKTSSVAEKGTDDPKYEFYPQNKRNLYKCTECDRYFTTLSTFTAHARFHRNGGRIFCDICDKEMSSPQALVAHQICHSEKRPFPCTICETRYKTRNELKQHLIVHKNITFKCSFCGKDFNKLGNCRTHEARHRKNYLKEFKCHVCEKIFHQRCVLKYHMRTHTGERPEVCEVCGSAFADKSNLKKHYLIHTGERPFLCKICDKGFNQQSSLTCHMRSHNTYKPFGCKHCGKMFGANEELIVHLRVHGQRLMFKCNACDLEFTEHSYLKSHQRMHTQFEQKTRKLWVYKEDLDLDDRNNFLRDGEQPSVAKQKNHSSEKLIKKQTSKLKTNISKRKKKTTDEDPSSTWHATNDDGSNGLDERVHLVILPVETIPNVPSKNVTSAKSVMKAKSLATQIQTETFVGPKTDAKFEITENSKPVLSDIESVYIKIEQSDDSDGELHRIDWKKFVEDRFSKQKTSGKTNNTKISNTDSSFNTLSVAASADNTTGEVLSVMGESSLKVKKDSEDIDDHMQYDQHWGDYDVGVEVKLEEIKEEVTMPCRTRAKVTKLKRVNLKDTSKIVRKLRSRKITHEQSFASNKTQQTPVKDTIELPKTQSSQSEPKIRSKNVPKERNDKKIIQCPRCPKRFSVKHSLEYHSLSHLTDFKCKVCSVDTVNVSGFRSHLKNNKPCRPKYVPVRRSLECEYCGMQFQRQRNLDGHLIIHTKTQPFQCDICKKYFRDKYVLKAHMCTHTGIMPFRCDQCDRGYATSGHLKEHMLCHTDLKPFKCDVCLRSYKSHYRLLIHKKIHLDDPYKCAHCGKGFKAMGNLQIHEDRHTAIIPDTKKWSCTMCTKVFNYKHKLTYHMRVHTGEKPYHCSECKASFADISNLQKHRRIHTGAMPYKCAVCDKKFNQLSSLNSHKKSHITYKAFECVHCSKCFAIEEDLTLHLRRLHGEKRNFKCNMCDREYEQLNHYKSHRRLHLGREVSKDERNVVLDQYGTEIQYKGTPHLKMNTEVANPSKLCKTNDVNVGRIGADGLIQLREPSETCLLTSEMTRHNQPQQFGVEQNTFAEL